MKTRITDLLGIEYPILQGGMAGVSEANLVAAVSNGGGLGVIAGSWAEPKRIEEEIVRIKRRTNNSFGVNILLRNPDAATIAQHLIEHQVPAAITWAGNPSPYMAAWRDAGIKVIPVVTTVDNAKEMEAIGAHAVIAAGGESGGNISTTNTLPLVAQVVSAVAIPVIAAGGIGDGRGLAAAIMLGAEGVQCGTRFIACKECVVSQIYKDMIIQAGSTATVRIGRSSYAYRSLVSPFVNEIREMAWDDLPEEEIEAIVQAALMHAVQGDYETGCFIAGQIAGLICDCPSAAEILSGMVIEAYEAYQGSIRYFS